MKDILILVSFSISVSCTSCKEQNKTAIPNDTAKVEAQAVINTQGPSSITRNIIEDRKGNMWLATWEGIFRYDGKSFTNMTSEVSSARFFSAMEDREGKLWFGSIGSGIYSYDGKSFRNFTTKEGLLNNEIVCIYQDNAGDIWFGTNGGVSRYNGKSFQNYMIEGDSLAVSSKGKTFPDFTRPPIEVNSIIEDNTGKFWLGTRGNAYVYDGKSFSILTHNGQPFMNIRSIIQDKTGTIWLGGNGGLWRYDASTFTNITPDFVGYLYEDRNGNVWTSSQTSQGWVLSRYEAKSLSDKLPTATKIDPNEKMLFGILEAGDGNIWFGTQSGAFRYDGNTISEIRQ